MSHDAVNELVREMSELLDVGSVGLYEFIWQLNGTHDGVPIEERPTVARQALDRLLASPGVELVWMKWPNPAAIRGASIDEVGPDAWNDIPADGRYLAIDRPA